MNYFLLIFIIVLFFSFYLFLEFVKAKFDPNTVVTRKIAHVISGVGVVLLSPYVSKEEYLLATVVFIIIFSYSFYKKILRSIHIKENIGEILYPVSLFLFGVFLYNEPGLFRAGVLILALADTVSAVAGRKFSKESNYFKGALGFWMTAFVILQPTVGVLAGIVMAAILAYVEYVSIKGWDNLTVPAAFIVLTFFL